MKASTISEFLGVSLLGDDIDVNGTSSLSNINNNTVLFVKKYSEDYISLLNALPTCLAIVVKDYENKLNIPHIISNNPRLDFAKVVQNFFSNTSNLKGIHPTAVVESGAIISRSAFVGAHAFIDSQVVVGDNSLIGHNVSIIGKVIIGDNCIIKPGAVIGGYGFGFEYDDNDEPVLFPHTGSVIIGNKVSIGSNTCIDRGTIDATVIEDNVKIDNLVHIGHNCHIKKNTFIIAGAVICGSVEVGEKCWISPNSSIHQKTKIGDNAKVGMGSVVITKVKDNSSVFGIPAKKIL